MQSSKSAEARRKYAQKTRKSMSADVPSVSRQDPPPTLTAPKTPVWWGGDADFAGLVPREDQEKDMTITVAQWPNGAPTGQQDTFIFEWKRSDETVWQVGNRLVIPGPIDPGGPDITVIFEMAYFARHGTYKLRYRVMEWNGLGEALSFPVDIIIDKEAPNYDGQSPDDAVYDAGAVDGITSQYLIDNGDVVTLTIPVYEGEALGDTVIAFVSTSAGPVSDPAYEGPLLVGRTISIQGALLRTLPDGLFHLNYRLKDKVGNLGQPSKNATTSLLLRALPLEPLALPRVELSEDDGTIDLDDVRATTLLVAIPRYGNWQENDFLLVNWGGVVTPVPHRVGPVPTDPIYVDIPFDTVLQPAYGDATKGKKSTDVSYQVLRGSRPFDSASITFDVDLSVPGPVNPDRPDPINPNLPPLTVFGATDAAKARPNELVAGDTRQAVTVDLVLYTPIAAGESLWFYWAANDNEVGTYAPPVGDDGNTYTFTIPWDKIETHPSSDKVPVYYEIGLTAGGNREKRVTEVDVSAALPVILAAPEFPDAGKTTGTPPVPILNCNSYLPDDPDAPTDYYVRVTFPANPANLAIGDILDIQFQGYTDPDGTAPLPDAYTTTRTVSQTDVDNGFTIQVAEYLKYIEPIGRFGSVQVNYSKQGSTAAGSASIWASTTRAGGTCWVLPTP